MCKIKKISAVILALIMTFSMFAGMEIVSNAYDTQRAEFVISMPEDISVGETFTVLVSLKNAVSLDNARITVHYNRSYIKFLSANMPLDSKCESGTNVSMDNNSGTVNWYITFSESFSGDTSVVELTFLALNEANTNIHVDTYEWNGLNLSCSDDLTKPYRRENEFFIKKIPAVFSYKVSKDNIEIGDTFDVIISVKNSNNLQYGKYTVEYDDKCIKRKDVQLVGVLADGKGKIVNRNFEDKIIFECKLTNILKDEQHFEEHELIMFSFEALQGGSHNISISFDDSYPEFENTTYSINVTGNPIGGKDGDFDYVVDNGEATITDCVSTVKGDIVIPSAIEGYPVTAIGDNAFSGCTGITKITLPDTVKTIGKYAFVNCSSLNSIVMPKNLVSIGESAFCEASALASINIPASVTSIGVRAFYKCKALSSITVDAGNKYYTIGADGVLYNKDKTVIVQYPAGSKAESYTVPNGVKSIGAHAFCSAANLKSVSFPASLTAIEECAFLFAYDLEGVVIPSTVTSVDGNAFCCTGIKTAVIQEGLTSIPGQLFGNCAHIESVSIPLSVTAIDLSAFYGCDNLDIYYNGTKEDWNKIEFEDFFTKPLETATIHYSSCNEIVIQSKENEININTLKNNDAFKQAVKNSKYTLADSYGKELAADALAGTGCIVKLYDAESALTEMKQIVVQGDVNGDGQITAADARLALRVSAELESIAGVYAIAADVNCDDEITAADARNILRKSAELE